MSEENASGHQVIYYRDKAGEWRWRREAENGNIIAESGEGYRHYADCRRMGESQFPNDTHIILGP